MGGLIKSPLHARGRKAIFLIGRYALGNNQSLWVRHRQTECPCCNNFNVDAAAVSMGSSVGPRPCLLLVQIEGS